MRIEIPFTKTDWAEFEAEIDSVVCDNGMLFAGRIVTSKAAYNVQVFPVRYNGEPVKFADGRTVLAADVPENDGFIDPYGTTEVGR